MFTYGFWKDPEYKLVYSELEAQLKSRHYSRVGKPTGIRSLAQPKLPLHQPARGIQIHLVSPVNYHQTFGVLFPRPAQTNGEFFFQHPGAFTRQTPRLLNDEDENRT